LKTLISPALKFSLQHGSHQGNWYQATVFTFALLPVTGGPGTYFWFNLKLDVFAFSAEWQKRQHRSKSQSAEVFGG
jgi:hypothetical protein